MKNEEVIRKIPRAEGGARLGQERGTGQRERCARQQETGTGNKLDQKRAKSKEEA